MANHICIPASMSYLVLGILGLALVALAYKKAGVTEVKYIEKYTQGGDFPFSCSDGVCRPGVDPRARNTDNRFAAPQRIYTSPYSDYLGYIGLGKPYALGTHSHFGYPSQGCDVYQKVGIVQQDGTETMGLYGRKKLNDKNRYEYYIIDDTRQMNKIPIETPRNNELYTGDTVTIPGYTGDFSVLIYDYATANQCPSY